MKQSARMNVFERYLSLWVGACMVLGVALGKLFPGLVAALALEGPKKVPPLSPLL